MNRGTVILLALAILVAHTFAIHQTPEGEFAATYEIAHVPYRIARNLVYEGVALWNPGGPSAESYPSLLWILVSAFATRLYASPILITQTLGVCSALAAVIVLAQFSPKRTAGLIAPLLLAASGSAAAAALSGTEATFAMLLVTTSFLAFDRGWGRTLALSLSLLLLARPEGGAILAALLLCERFWRPQGVHGRRPPRWRAFRVPVLVALAGFAARRTLTGQWLSPFASPLLELDQARWRLGSEYLVSFAISSGFGLLILAVILSIFARRNSALGGRALLLTASWWGLVVLSGGDELPFWNALVPVLPLFFLGLQESLREWMDERVSLARVVWPLLAVSMAASFLVSKTPGDIGPLPLERVLTRWQTPSAALASAYPRPLGRLGLLEEIRASEHLRTLGVFLRDRVGADAVILSSWPGAIGYLSRKEVLDLLGRTTPPPGSKRPRSWRGFERVDVIGALTRDVDYIVPMVGTLGQDDVPGDFLVEWLARYDVVGPTEERVRELLVALEGLQLVSVPVPARSRIPRQPSEHPFPLLRRRDLERTPTLSVEATANRLRVSFHHEGHQQVVDLCVRAVKPDGEELYLSPTGNWRASRALDARTSLLAFQTGLRPIQLIEARLPAGWQGTKITAWLHNPGMGPDLPLSAVGTPVSLQL